MKLKTTLALISLLMFSYLSAPAQIRIGYTNIELILAYMPEAKSMEQTLTTYQKKLAEKLKVKEDYSSSKLQEYISLKEANRLSPEEQANREKELMKLDEELRKMAADSEYDLMAKRQELLEPILNKVQDAIDNIAKTEGFTYILNQTTSAGVSTILYGPGEDDVTEKLLRSLNITIPKE